MIERIKISSVDRQNTPSKNSGSNSKQPSFGGLEVITNGLIQGVQLCEKYPMVNVSALDLSSAIIPRTWLETKKANAHAGFEAFRRESSGLVVNCLLPSFIVWGAAKLLQKPIMGAFNKSNLSNAWANSELIDKNAKYYEKASGTGVEKAKNAFKNMLYDLYGVDGNAEKGGLKAFKDFNLEKAVDKFGEALTSENADKAAKKAYEAAVKELHISENIKFKGENYFSSNLESVFKDSAKIMRGFVEENVSGGENLASYVKKAKRLVNGKSALGLAIIIPLAISMQPINRWITRKTSGKKGAPIYKDFDNEEAKELTPKQKGELLRQKFVSVGSMIGVALLSMMKVPKWSNFQFNGIFPTMDQARLISTATFASRMAAAEDKNELQMATVRDIATFSSFYFLGDYAAKGIASAIEHFNKDVKLLNKTKDVSDDANVLKRFWNWVKNTHLKSSDELFAKDAKSLTKLKNLRTACQIGNLGFSLAILGLIVPLFTLDKANKNHKRQQAGFTGAASTDRFNKMFVKNNSSVAFSHFMANK